MAANTLPPVEYLRECFDYDPDTGVLVWKERPAHHFKHIGARNSSNLRCAGKSPDVSQGGRYAYVNIGYKRYLAHRVIFKLMTGQDPPETVDHVNGNPRDNRWTNLRGATRSQNQSNLRIRRDKKIPLKGFYRWSYKGNTYYVASVNHKGKRHHIGYFKTPEEAHSAYCAKAQELHGEFFNPG